MRSGLASLAAAVTVIAGCGEANQYVPPPPPEVVVAQPVTDEVTDYLEFTGATRATDQVQLRARANGYLQSIEFEDGATVKKGDLLFVIEPEPFEAALALAQANLQKAEASLKLADADLRRTTPLVKRGALPEQELDVKAADLATAEADVASAKAALRVAELNLSYTRIVAPLDGRIGQHLVDVGNLVQAESTILTTIESYNPIHAYFNVSEGDVLRLMELRGAEAPTAGPPKLPELSLALDNGEGFVFKGDLDFADLGVDPSTGTQTQRGEFQNPDGRLVPGLFVRLRLPIGKPESKLLISERAIAVDQRGEYVLVVNDQDEVEYRSVKLGLAVEGLRVVEEGVQPRDWIVVTGLQRARPGSKIVPKRLNEMTAGAPNMSAAAVEKTALQPLTGDRPQAGG